jgi:hypothetical protein
MNWVILAAILFAVCIECVASEGSSMTTERLEGGYSVRVRDTIKTTQISTVEDFMLYSMTDLHGKIVLQIYLGNFPSGPIKDGGRVVHSATAIGGFPATLTQWRCGKSLFCGDVRIRLLDGNGWPAFAHMFYSKLSKAEAAISRDIISSFAKEPRSK